MYDTNVMPLMCTYFHFEFCKSEAVTYKMELRNWNCAHNRTEQSNESSPGMKAQCRTTGWIDVMGFQHWLTWSHTTCLVPLNAISPHLFYFCFVNITVHSINEKYWIIVYWMDPEWDISHSHCYLNINYSECINNKSEKMQFILLINRFCN